MQNKIFTLLFLLVFVSCQKDFLEKSPIIGVTEDNFYRTEADAIAAVNAYIYICLCISAVSTIPCGPLSMVLGRHHER